MLLFLLGLVLCKVKEKVAVGIDLGTTFSCVHIFKKGADASTLESIKFDGNDIVPSVVKFEEINGKWILMAGYDAFRENENKPDADNYFYAFKRLMGRSSLREDKDLIDIDKKVTYKIQEDRKSDKQGSLYMLHKKNGEVINKITPVEASAAILRMIREKVEEDYEIEKCAVTVPAYFGENQRNATMIAAKGAGLGTPSLYFEPVMAAYAYQMKAGLGGPGSKFVVFDQGGGTLDISALEFGDKMLEVVATVGNNFLGGENINDLLFEHFAAKLKKDGHSVERPEVRLRLRKFVEEFKIELCNKQNESTEDVTHTKEFAFKSGVVYLTLSTKEFNEVIKPVLTEIEYRLKDADFGIIPKVERNGWKKKEIGDVLCVGGTSRVPAIRELLKKFFPDAKLRYDIDADRIVSEGAAYQAAHEIGYLKKSESLMYLDTVPIPIGICVSENSFYQLIKEQATVPAGGAEVFTTSHDNQKTVLIKVGQGFSPIFNENELLGEFHLEIEKPAPRGVPKIEVKVDWSMTGDLNVSAVDQNSNKEAKIKFARTDAQLSDGKINELKKKALDNKERDEELLETYKERQALEYYIESVQSRMVGPEVTNDARHAIERAVYGVQSWLEKERNSADKYGFREKHEKLKTVVEPLLEGKASDKKTREEL